MNSNPKYMQFESFKYKTLRDLEIKIHELGLEIPISNDLEILKQNIKVNNRTIPHRLSIQPMEGFDANLDGSPGDLTYRRYERYAKGGASLIWFEATAINKDCRSSPHQLMLSRENYKQFVDLVSNTREICNNTLEELGFKHKCVLILQLNHSGRYSVRDGKKYPIRAYHNSELDDSRGLSIKDGIIITDNELESLEDNWVQKALLAKEVGFDGVDIKSCHGYLIHELFCSRMRVNSRYGGESLDNRAKFFLNIIYKLKKEFGNDKNFLITTRMSLYDGIPYPNGFGVKNIINEVFPASIDLTEPLELIKRLYNLGIRLINITAGNPHYKPHITRPFDTPTEGGNLPNEHPLYGVNRLIRFTSFIKQHIPEDMKIIGSGYSYLRQFASNVTAGLIHENNVDICGFGRMALANPNFPKQIFQEGFIDKNQVCISCSKCSELMKLGNNVGCVSRDPQYQ
ncbi:MAG: flavin oxidoreductase/NADH oxidase [Promethearchaeota archaeon]